MNTKKLFIFIFICMQFSINISKANEVGLVFLPKESYLAMGGVDQSRYISGMLDALYYIHKLDSIDDRIMKCIFYDKNSSHILVSWMVANYDFLKMEENHEKLKGSIVETFIKNMNISCP